MREMLFRGKRVDNGEWVEGCGIIATENWVSILAVIDDLEDNSADVEEYEVVSETVGQYTGLTDKNGKKIFEGDIIQTLMIEYNPPRQYRKPYQVNYNSDFPSVVEEHYSPFEHFTEKVEYEVIGNIHDNPELIKGGEDK